MSVLISWRAGLGVLLIGALVAGLTFYLLFWVERGSSAATVTLEGISTEDLAADGITLLVPPMGVSPAITAERGPSGFGR